VDSFLDFLNVSVEDFWLEIEEELWELLRKIDESFENF
jgi:hypothetical protein